MRIKEIAKLDSKVSYGRAAAETLSIAGLPIYLVHSLETCQNEDELYSRLETMPDEIQYQVLAILTGSTFRPDPASMKQMSSLALTEALPLVEPVEQLVSVDYPIATCDSPQVEADFHQARPEPDPVSSSMNGSSIATFLEGHSYTKEQIGSALGCEMKGYLPNKDGQVLCATVTKAYNPDAPEIILPGFGPQIEHWGSVFCSQKSPVPVFVKAVGSLWTYVGEYQVTRFSKEPTEMSHQRLRSGRNDISMVIFLRKTTPSDNLLSGALPHDHSIPLSTHAVSKELLRTAQAPSSMPTVNPISSEYTPSIYQQVIYDFQSSGSGDGFVEAVAGSGKTTTLVGCAERLQKEECKHAIFVAFNKHIAVELGTRLPSGVTAQTIHSIGLKAFRSSLRNPSTCEVMDRKYERLSEHFLKIEAGLRNDKRLRDLKDTLTKLIHFFMVTLTNPSDGEAVQSLAHRFDLMIEDWQIEIMKKAVPIIISWGQSGLPERDKRGLTYAMRECISYDDMIYLPSALDLPLPTYRMVYCDEAQDLSAAQLEIVLKLRAPGGRILFVGDPRQSIYAFAGADSGSVDTILKRTSAVRLPLSVCYRCPRLHVEMAKKIVPQIEARKNAPEGIFAHITEEELVAKVRPDDLILCRLTAPLVETAFDLISGGKPAKVRGREIGEDLIAVVTSVERIKDYSWTAFVEHLYQYRTRTINLLRHEEADPLAITSVQDRVRTVEIIHQKVVVEGLGESAADLKTAIQDLFREEAGATVLSTVHRAKGLESSRVFVLQEWLMPHPRAQKPEQIAQEWNLRYVALTRAIEELYFVGKAMPDTDSMDETEVAPSMTDHSTIHSISTKLVQPVISIPETVETIIAKPQLISGPFGAGSLTVQIRPAAKGEMLDLLIFDKGKQIGEYEKCSKVETIPRKVAEIEAAATALRAAFADYGYFVVRWNGTIRQKEIHQGAKDGRVIGTVPWK